MRCFTARVGTADPAARLACRRPLNLRLRARRAAARRILYAIIADRRAAGEDRGDLLSMLLHAQDEEGGAADDRPAAPRRGDDPVHGRARDHRQHAGLGLVPARDPPRGRGEAPRRARRGARRPAARRSPTCPGSTYTEQVVTEALRLYPTVWLLGREAIEPTEVGGYRVPVGMTVFMSQWVVHRDPRWFDDPEAFRPERWADGLAKRIPRYAYFPFGGGPRICIGNNFALMEAVAAAGDDRPPVPPRARPRTRSSSRCPTMTLRPERGVNVVLEHRA